VRRDEAVFCLQQRVVHGDRLHLYGVKACGCNFTAVKRVRGILVDDQAAAAVVDYDRTVFHFSNRILADHVLGIIKQGTVQQNHVRIVIQRVQIDIAAAGGFPFRVAAGVVS